MYLIAGLGNPERRFDKTKHNAGFDAVDEIIKRFDIPLTGTAMKGAYGKGMINGEKVMILKPLTYMNLSGHAIRAYVDYYNIDPEEELIVLYDDADLNPGQIRVRKKGRPGSHNGMKDIVTCLGTETFKRIRIGIGARPQKWDMADYVLAPFSKDERVLVEEAFADAADAVEMIVGGDIDRAMEKYNKKVRIESGNE